MRRFFVKAVVLAASVVALAGAFVMPAAADPPAGTACDINSVGSDTLQYVDNDLANGYNSINPPLKWCSWDATNPTTGAVHDSITLKPGCTITRPDGSSEGITALQNYPNCVDFARSIRGPRAGDTDPVTGLPLLFVRYLQDTMQYALANITNGSSTLSAAQLKAIYTTPGLTWGDVDPALPRTVIHPMLPQGPETRSFFLGSIGVLDPPPNATTVPGSIGDYCRAIANDPDAIGPMSRGILRTILPPCQVQLDTVPPGYSAARFGYHVVRNAGTAAVPVIPAYLQSILGNNDPTGYTCSAAGSSIITQNGFDVLSPIDCGAI